MKIQNLNNSIYPNTFYGQTRMKLITPDLNKLSVNNPLNVPAISFESNNARSGRLYQQFLDEYKRQYPNASPEDTIKDVIEATSEINHGKEKRIYSFPKMNNYLIGYLYGKSLENIPKIHQSKMELPKYYFGQPIATNDDNVIIMKKINGVPNSANHYWSLLRYIKKNGKVTKKASKEYLAKLRIFSKFPQRSYDKLAEQLIYINKNSDMIDFINANNLLIDKEGKQFNLIDMVDMIDIEKYCNKNDIPPLVSAILSKIAGLLNFKRNSDISYNMYSLILDSKLQPYFLDKLSKSEQEEVRSISKDVINKCQKALENCNWTKKENSLKTRLIFITSDILLGLRLNSRYGEFLNTYGL